MKADHKKTATYIAIGVAVVALLYFVLKNTGAKKKEEEQTKERQGSDKKPQVSEFKNDLPFEPAWDKEDEDLSPAESHEESEIVKLGDYSQTVAEMQRRVSTWMEGKEVNGKAGKQLRSDIWELTGLDIANGVQLASITEKKESE